MKPPFCYYGGKQRMAQQIVSMFPDHETYVEPYFGGGAVFFEKNPSPVEVINDKNEVLINFFRVLRDEDERERLITLLKETPYSKSDFKLARSILADRGLWDDVRLAWAWFVTIEMSFSKRMGSAWSFMSRHTRGLQRPEEWKRKKRRLQNLYRERLEETQIECDDALNIIDRYDGERTLFYLDPPYVGADQGPYKGFSEENLYELVERLKSVKGSFILSHYDHPLIPSEWARTEVQTHCAVNHKVRTKRTEVLYYVGRGFTQQQELFRRWA